MPDFTYEGMSQAHARIEDALKSLDAVKQSLDTAALGVVHADERAAEECAESESECNRLQEDLNSLEDWHDETCATLRNIAERSCYCSIVPAPARCTVCIARDIIGE